MKADTIFGITFAEVLCGLVGATVAFWRNEIGVSITFSAICFIIVLVQFNYVFGIAYNMELHRLRRED
jgi:hypothetical protein